MRGPATTVFRAELDVAALLRQSTAPGA